MAVKTNNSKLRSERNEHGFEPITLVVKQRVASGLSHPMEAFAAIDDTVARGETSETPTQFEFVVRPTGAPHAVRFTVTAEEV